MKVKLGDIFEIGSGGTPPKSHPEYYGGNIPWVKTGDLKTTYLYSVEDFITEDGLNNSSAKMYEPDTVLIAMYGATIGATSILKINACTNQACAAFKPNDKVKPEYLYYFLRSKRNEFIKDGVGGAQPNISAGYLKKVSMELPEIKEQNEIVDILNKISDVVEMRKKELMNLDNLIKARFVELFGTSTPHDIDGENYVSVASVCSSMMIGPFGSALHKPEMSTSGEVFVLGTDNAVKNEFAVKEERFISFEKYSELTKYTVKSGDLIITMMGTIGRVAVIPDGFHKAIISSHLSCLTPDFNVIYSRFLHAVLTLDDGISLQIAKQKKGAIMSGLNLGIIKNLRFKMVAKDKQKVFLDFVEQVDKSKVVVQKALDEAQLLFDSLMQKYFG